MCVGVCGAQWLMGSAFRCVYLHAFLTVISICNVTGILDGTFGMRICPVRLCMWVGGRMKEGCGCIVITCSV